MLFRAEELNTGLLEAGNVLNEAAYVGSPIMALSTISIVEDVTLNKGVVRFADIEAFSEETGADYIDIMAALSESNDLDPDDLVVAVDEADIILDPSIILELANVVVNPISENSLAYRFCEACVDAWLDTGDEEYLETIVDEAINLGAGSNNPAVQQKINAKQNAQRLERGKKFFWGGLGTLAAAYGAKKLYQNRDKVGQLLTAGREKAAPYIAAGREKAGQLLTAGREKAGQLLTAGREKVKDQIRQAVNDKPEASAASIDAEKVMKEADKNGPRWISRKIASLRSMYANWMQKAQEEHDQNKAGIFKKIAFKIMSVIDALMEKLQKLTH